MYSAYEKEELQFKNHVKPGSINDTLADANFISSHTIYKIKIVENGSQKLKSRIAPHCNVYSRKDQLKSDCCMCIPVGICIVLSIASINKWTITKSDDKAVFLKTGPAQIDVYVRPPRESKDKMHY